MKPRRSLRSMFRQVVSAGALSAMLFAQNAAAFSIAQNPPFLPTPLPPNIVMTFDDSGSMRWAYAPDSMCGENATRRAKSSDYNPLYYDPKIKYEPPLSYSAGAYTEFTTGWPLAYINGFAPSFGTINLETGYRPTWSYNPENATVHEGGGLCGDNTQKLRNNYAPHPSADYASTSAGTRAYYYVYNPDQCATKSLTDDNCYKRVQVGVDAAGGGVVTPAFTDETKNFAIWYSFYRTRNLMTATSATRALVGVPPTSRVGWQSLSSCNTTTTTGTTYGRLFDSSCRGWTGNYVDKRIKVFGDQHRANLYYWLARLPADGGTPLRTALSRAGEYFRTNGVNSPYAENPTVSPVGTEYSCRPNFHILMTDGIWNDSTGSFCSGSSCGNKDDSTLTLPRTT